MSDTSKEKLSNATLIFENKVLLSLLQSHYYEDDGRILIDCFLKEEDIDFHNDDNYFRNFPGISQNSLDFTIEGITSAGSKIIFKKVGVKRSSYPSLNFTFICLHHSIEYVVTNENDLLASSFLKSFVIEGISSQYSKLSTTKRIRTIFGEDDSHDLVWELDHTEIPINLYFKKRYYDFKIAIIKHPKIENAAIIRFYGEFSLPYRVFQKIRFSIKYFISFLTGTNIVIREENYQGKGFAHFIKSFSEKVPQISVGNKYLPIKEPIHRHAGFLKDYSKTISLYLYLDKKLKLSEIIYLINQSKKLDFETEFFILLIAIEKLASQLIQSDLLNEKEKNIMDDQKFKNLLPSIWQKVEDTLKKNVTNNQLAQFKTKIHNLNRKGKTDYKIDLLLDYAEIEKTPEVLSLFPKLRNLAIHEGKISSEEDGHYENYTVLFNLVNEIICNLIQYKGKRLVSVAYEESKIDEKKEFAIDYHDKIGYVNYQ